MGKIVLLEDNPGLTEEHYWDIVGKTGHAHDLPDGCHVHIAGMSPDGHLRVITVWDDRETMETFHKEVLHQERKEHLKEDVKRQIWELENLVVTDRGEHVAQPRA